VSEKIENLLEENRKFSPSESLTKNANATSSWFQEANENRLEFWKKQALERITWFKEPTEVLDDSNAPFYKWFKDGELNLSYNCLDRHLENDGDRVAFIGRVSQEILRKLHTVFIRESVQAFECIKKIKCWER